MNARQHTSLTSQNDDKAVMTAFQSVLDQFVQSNVAIMDNEGLEIVLQIVENNRGGKREDRAE